MTRPTEKTPQPEKVPYLDPRPTHTPEPVAFIQRGPFDGFLCTTRQDGSVPLNSIVVAEIAKADPERMHRIVACVNACQGIADPAAALPALIEAAERAAQWIQLVTEGTDASALDYIEREHRRNEVFGPLRAALARAKGGQP